MLRNGIFLCKREVPMNRDFKGIWIPREIWLHKGLTRAEKDLWAEVHSLYDRKRNGCFASNEYLADFLSVSERYVREMISKLKKLGLMKEVSFDGRTRVIMALLPPEDFDDEYPSDRNSSSSQTGTPVPPSPELQFREPTHSPYIYNKDENKEREEQAPEPSLKKSISIQKKKNKSDSEPKIPFGTYVTLKEGEYEELCKSMPQELVDHYINKINNYVANAKPYKDYAATVRQWHLSDLEKNHIPFVNEKNNESNELFAQKVKKLNFNNDTVILGNAYIEFVYGQHVDHIKFTDKGFKEQVINQLRKRNLNFKGLINEKNDKNS